MDLFVVKIKPTVELHYAEKGAKMKTVWLTVKD